MTAVHYPNCSPGIESYSFREEAMTAIFTLAPRAGFLPRRSDVSGEMSAISNNGCGRGCSGKQDGMREEKLGRTYVCTETGK